VVGDVTVDVTVVPLSIAVGVVEYSVETTVVAYVIVVGLVTYMVEQYKSTATDPSSWRFRSLTFNGDYG
jgi:hypothetical protein